MLNIRINDNIRYALIITLFCLVSCSKENYIKISVEEYNEKVYASWLGQIIGNIYGLPHENDYIDESGPDSFPYGYNDNMVSYMKEATGAFSDDDTDFEYIYLTAMEEHGIEPSYAQLTDKWLYHVHERVWLANRAALAFMHYGYTPPATGYREINPHWFQIDPQLINEIWAVTAPGMVDYAANKSAWAARITNDDWGIHPTIHYGAMYSAAFFESDIDKLIEIGNKALPSDSRFIETVNDMKLLYRKYPNDWQLARQELDKKYYDDEPLDTKTIWNANLNGAAGILALLYGKGDFQRTLDLACAIGYDADNQAATMSGLLGIIGGLEGIPRELLYPVKDKDWELPFNDFYLNVTRYDLPNASLKDMASRMAKIGEKIILNNGGKKETINGIEYYLINPDVEYVAPLEIPNGPLPYMEVGKPVEFTFSSTYEYNYKLDWEIVSGILPEGVELINNTLIGTPNTPGIFPIKMKVSSDSTSFTREFNIVIRNNNLAMDAAKILSSVEVTDVAKRDSMWLSVAYSLYSNDVVLINDGQRLGNESTFYSISEDSDKMIDYYGYQWDELKTINMLNLHMGSVEENGGWFTSINVEYNDMSGNWNSVNNLKMMPELLSGETRFNKAHFIEYILTFDSVRTNAIRIIGEAGGAEHWFSDLAHFTSITELSVHGPIID